MALVPVESRPRREARVSTDSHVSVLSREPTEPDWARSTDARLSGMPRESVAVVVGTRPEAIKMSEIVRRLGHAAVLLHTGQHYSQDLWSSVADDLGLPCPHETLSVGGASRSAQIGDAVTALGAFLRRNDRVRAVMVHGDTNATLAGALAANAEGVPLVHVEAGLRSWDRRMPEEHNRVLVDHLADVCFAPSVVACQNLAAEGISDMRIALTGNTIVEVVRQLLPAKRECRRLCDAFGVEPGRFVLATVHRPENTDNAQQLHAILADLRALEFPVLLALHPRTRGIADPASVHGLRVVEALPPRTFLGLLAESGLVVTDSGGVQEEVTVLGRPALIVRRSTERPEALGRWCDLVQPGHELRTAACERLASVEEWRHKCSCASPYGDGRASQRIVEAVANLVGAGSFQSGRLTA